MGEAATMPARAERRAEDGAGDERGVGWRIRGATKWLGHDAK